MQTTIPDVDGNVSRTVFLQFYEEYDVADQAVAEAIGARKDLRKRIKGAGFHLGAFDHTRKEAQKDTDLRNQEDREFRRNMAWLNKPLGYQEDWVGAPIAAEEGNGADDSGISTHQIDQVKIHGRQAGANGANRDTNPWGIETVLHKCWDDAWIAGQAEIAAAMGDPPARRGRGRPPGAKNKPKRAAV